MKVFGGDIIDQREDAVEFVKEHIKLHAKIVGMERIETWEYPIDAIREGITNKEYQVLFDVSRITATRDLKLLEEDGILKRIGKGKRNLKYVLK